MLDIHCHLLPDVDDGAQSLEEACMMARIAMDGGTNAIVVTPHWNVPDHDDTLGCEYFLKQFKSLSDAFLLQKIPLKLLMGMEVFATDDVAFKIESGSALMINASRYIMLEFFMNDHPLRVNGILDEVMHLGLIPVIAHPERYAFVQHELDIAYCWKRKGCLLQINKGSLLGAFGRRIQKTACDMLSLKLAHVVASDAHSPYQRTPNLFDAYEYISDHFSRSYADDLMQHAPLQIISNQ